MMHETEWLKKTLLMLAVCISISACLQVFQQYFIYWRFSFFAEPWRWWTGHWVHVGWIHFLLNILAFICLPFIFPIIRKRYLIFLLLVLSPCISFCTLFILKFRRMQVYRVYYMVYMWHVLWRVYN